MSCPNCGAALADRRCAQCGAVVPAPDPDGDGAAADRVVRQVDAGSVAVIFAMPLASTWPQSRGHGRSWWVCAAVKPMRSREVLAKGLTQEAAVRLAAAVAARLQLL